MAPWVRAITRSSSPPTSREGKGSTVSSLPAQHLSCLPGEDCNGDVGRNAVAYNEGALGFQAD